MAYEISLAFQAMADLELIYERIGAETSAAAERWYRGLELAIASLAEMPHRCPDTPEHPNLKHLLYGNKPHVYRIIFETDATQNTVKIVQVRHGARRPITN